MQSITRILLGLFMFVESAAYAQPFDEVAESLGLVPDRNALPVWTNAPDNA